MTQPNDLQRNILLTQIINSPEFQDSKRAQDLLKYLVEKSSTVTFLKETEIAYDVFGKDSKFDPSNDSLIRSYISNLRKKLDHYYLTTEDQLEFKLEIPKGHYIVKYTPVHKAEKIKNAFNYKPFFYPAIVFMIAIAVGIFFFNNSSNKMVAENSIINDPVWSSILNTEKHATMIVIGDYLFLSEKIKDSGRTFTRIPQVNSEEAFNRLAQKNPGKFGNLEISEVTYIGAGASLGITYLMQAFAGTSQKFFVKLSHELKWDDVENQNIIYIGTFKTLYKLDTLFSRTNIRHTIRPNSLSVMGKADDTVKTFKVSWVGGTYQKDYSVIMKLLTSKNNTILFLLGFSEVGVMEAVKTLIDPDINKKLSNFSKDPNFFKSNNFEMILEVEGLRYTVFNSKIIYSQNF